MTCRSTPNKSNLMVSLDMCNIVFYATIVCKAIKAQLQEFWG